MAFPTGRGPMTSGLTGSSYSSGVLAAGIASPRGPQETPSSSIAMYGAPSLVVFNYGALPVASRATAPRGPLVVPDSSVKPVFRIFGRRGKRKHHGR